MIAARRKALTEALAKLSTAIAADLRAKALEKGPAQADMC